MKRKSKKQLGNLDGNIKAAIINDLAVGMSKREVANKYSIDIGKVFIVADHSKDEIAAIKQQKEDETKKAAEEQKSGMIINNIELVSDDIEILDNDSKEESNSIHNKEKNETPKNPEEDKSKKDLGVVVIGRKVLTRDIIIQIVNDLKAGMDQTSVAIKRNFSTATINRVKRVEIDHAYGIYKDYPYSRLEDIDEETKKTILDNMAKGIKPPQYINKGPHSVKGTRNSSQLNPKKEKKETTVIPVGQQQPKEKIKPVEDKKKEQVINKAPSTDETVSVYKTSSIVTNIAPIEKKHPNESKYGNEFTLLRKHTCINVGLVADRHAQPVRDYVFKSIDSATMFNYDKLDEMAEAWIKENVKFNDGHAESSVACYTTGLQCALASFIKACYKFKVNLVLMHYNAENQKYFKQDIFTDFEYKTRENESICPDKLLEATKYSRHLYAFKSIDDIISNDIIYEVVEVYYNSSRAQLFTDTALFADKADAWFYFMEKSEEKTKNKSIFINIVSIADGNYKKMNNLAKKTS